MIGLELFVGLAIVVCPIICQTTPRRSFEVASVRPSAPGGRGGIIRPLPGNQTYIARNMPLRAIMTVAYSVTDRRISGGPEWVDDQRFDINAKADRSYTSDELHVMLQRLLEERFQLKVRHEKRELPVWALVVNKGGPKLQEHDPNDIDHPPIGPNPQGRGVAGRNVSMEYFAFVLSRLLDRNVIDRTGLTQHYDITLDFVREGLVRLEGGNPAGPAANVDGPTIFRCAETGGRAAAGSDEGAGRLFGDRAGREAVSQLSQPRGSTTP
jgi:uncharacterized protein (TIGR03435 family)